MNVTFSRLSLSVLMSGCAIALSLTGCQGLTVNNVAVDTPNLTVGGSTRIRVDTSSFPGRTVQIQAQALRGRILPDTFTNQRELRYYAPFTSRAADQGGNLIQGDTVTLTIQDGVDILRRQVSVNLSGSTITFVENADANGQGVLKLATCTDDAGTQIASTREVRDVGGTTLRGAQPTLSPDGRLLAFVSYPGNGATSAIATVDAAGRTQTVIPSGGQSGFNLDPAWSPDSRTMAFVSNRGGNGLSEGIFRLFSVKVGNDVTPTLITSTERNLRFPAWNPSTQAPLSSQIIASAQANDSSELRSGSSLASAWNLFLFDQSTGQFVKRLTTYTRPGDFAFETRWNPSGQVFAFTAKGPINTQLSGASSLQRVIVQRINNNEGSGAILNLSQTSSGLLESTPTWSPDGNRLIYLNQTGTSVVPIDGQPPVGAPWFQLVRDAQSTNEPPQALIQLMASIPGLAVKDYNQAQFILGGGFNWR